MPVIAVGWILVSCAFVALLGRGYNLQGRVKGALAKFLDYIAPRLSLAMGPVVVVNVCIQGFLGVDGTYFVGGLPGLFVGVVGFGALLPGLGFVVGKILGVIVDHVHAAPNDQAR